MRPGINFCSSASPSHITHGRTFVSGYDVSETAKYCARYPKCFEINSVICGLQFVLHVVVVPINLENRHISKQHTYIVTSK